MLSARMKMVVMTVVMSGVMILPIIAGSVQEEPANVWEVSQGDRLRVELDPSEISHDLLLKPLSADAEPFLSFVEESYVTPSYTGRLCDSERRLCHVELNRTLVVTTREDGDGTAIIVMTICGVKPLMTAKVKSGYPLGVAVGSERGKIQAMLNVTTADHLEECPKVIASNAAPIVIGVMLLVVAVGVIGFVVYGRKNRNQGVPVESDEEEKKEKEETPEREHLDDKQVV
ncbi:uncharacterized protein LOC122244970 [Penaeus japonicus]|uniref:uncharacterized protein LOC122244970 n=1 Tax=Penaeus japonicus TaxID=27405 RepID=UPI001C70EE2C|nr:uncharacterized protein LOC122244970 [Penaeus japonicus]